MMRRPLSIALLLWRLILTDSNGLLNYKLWNIQYVMDKPSLCRDHNGKCANGHKKHFSCSIDMVCLKLFFQISGQDS